MSRHSALGTISIAPAPGAPAHRGGEGHSLTGQIRQLLADHARLAVDIASVDDDADLFLAGMSSHATVDVMLALETEFDVEFPDTMLRREMFETIAAIAGAVMQLALQAA